jgi:predicted AlkP superfamily phosphohydrolase/phosphomutase
VIRAVHQREDVYHGPHSGKDADLLIEWDYEVARDSLGYASDEGSVVVEPRKEPQSHWNANHRPEGIFIACGPHIKRGMKLDSVSIYDIAPTVLYLQGHPVAKDMDGKVLADIFTEQQLDRYPIVECEPTSVEAQTDRARLDRDEEREIEERLKGLGYIE